MFRIITALSKTSKLANIHPIEKIMLTIVSIVIVGFSKSMIPLFVNICFFMLLHLKVKNNLKIVIKFTAGAAGFAMLSSITFIFNYSLSYSAIIILKTISGGSALSFLALTTPLDDILYFVSRCNSLRDVCDITKNMERFLVLIEDEYIIMYNSMKCRGGFDSFSLKIKNTGKLAALLFKNTMERWTDIKNGINSRGYRGYMPYLKREFTFSTWRLSAILVYNLFLICLVRYC